MVCLRKFTAAANAGLVAIRVPRGKQTWVDIVFNIEVFGSGWLTFYDGTWSCSSYWKPCFPMRPSTTLDWLIASFGGCYVTVFLYVISGVGVIVSNDDKSSFQSSLSAKGIIIYEF